jgi:hypothetical protein
MRKVSYFIHGLFMIFLPKEAVKAKKLARQITFSEFEVDPDEWKKLSDEKRNCKNFRRR